MIKKLALSALSLLLMLLLATCGSSSTRAVTQTPGSPNTTPSVNSTPTAAPSVLATPSAPTGQPAAFKLAFTCNTATGPSSGPVRVCVKTLPGASLSIKVAYCDSVIDNSKALQGTFTADMNGKYTWNWNEPATCAGQGIWKKEVDVTAILGGQTTSIQAVGQA